MRKVGILTYHFAENKNFGAILQSYAMLNLCKKFYFQFYVDVLPLKN